MSLTIYQPYDVRDYIEAHVDSNVHNLADWKMSDVDRAEIISMTRSVVTGGKNYLANKIPFASSFGVSVNTHITFQLDAPMAVNIAMGRTALTPRMNLFVNPFWLFYKGGILGDKFIDDESFEDVAAILLHEYMHLLYDHHSKYKFYLERGYGNIVNIATDCQINQDPMIEANKALMDYGITLDSVRHITEDNTLKAKQNSEYYFEALMKKADELKDSSSGNSWQMSSGMSNSESNSDSNGSSQSSDGENSDSNQSQSSNGDPMGQKASHDAWNKTPDDVSDDAGDEPASADAAVQAIADAVETAVELSGESLESIKNRGLVSSHIVDRIMNGTAERGKLPIKSVLMRGAGRLKMSERKTYRKVNPHQGNRVDVRRGKVFDNAKNVRTFIDNSGSMGASEINWAMNEISAVAKKVKANLEVIPFDTVVYDKNKQYASKTGKWSFTPVGRGGTAFQPVFDWLNNEKANNRDDLIIIITDGYGERHVNTYGLSNVIWLLVEEKENTLSVKDPVGQVAWLDQDDKYKLHKLNSK